MRRAQLMAAATVVLSSMATAASAQERVLAEGPGYLVAATPQPDGTYGLRQEATSAGRIQALGGRSASAQFRVDCAHHQSGISSMRVFQGSGLSGEATEAKPGAWLKSAPVDLFDLTEALCSGAGAAPPPPAAPAPAAPAEPAPAAVASAGPETSAEPAPPAAAEAAPAEEPPAPALRQHVTAAAILTKGRWVQLGAFGTEELAEAEWGKLQPAIGAPSHRLEPVQRGDATLFRLLAGPFPSAAAAKSACTAAVAAGAVCLVR